MSAYDYAIRLLETERTNLLLLLGEAAIDFHFNEREVGALNEVASTLGQQVRDAETALASLYLLRNKVADEAVVNTENWTEDDYVDGDMLDGFDEVADTQAVDDFSDTNQDAFDAVIAGFSEPTVTHVPPSETVIRAWANANGVECPPKGRVTREVKAKYFAANPVK